MMHVSTSSGKYRVYCVSYTGARTVTLMASDGEVCVWGEAGEESKGWVLKATIDSRHRSPLLNVLTK